MSSYIASIINTKALLKFAVVTFALSAMFLFVGMSQAQGLAFDPEQAQKLGEAAEKSNAAAYVLGVVSVLSISLAAWTISKRDESQKDIQDLAAAIRAQTASMLETTVKDDRQVKQDMTKLANAMEIMAKKPCGMDSETLKDIIRGKFAQYFSERR